MTAHYGGLCQESLRKAQELLARGDSRQASEELWGAAAQAVKALADRRGWEHGTHAVLYNMVNQVARELNDYRIRDLFAVAGQLHVNFYENWMDLDWVKQGAERVGEFVQILEQLP